MGALLARKGEAEMASNFYETMPIFDNFAQAVRPENYRPLPDDWIVGFSDVVGSTQAVADGRYKAVNMVGAGVIAAIVNALNRRAFPFVFGGDGASFAVSGADAPAATEALAAMAIFAREEFQFDLRMATIPASDIRAAGRDIRSPDTPPRGIAFTRCSRAADWRGLRSRSSEGPISCRPRRPARVPISPVSPVAGASRRQKTALFCR